MSNADFYNNIKKQAATMEGSYPELSKHISEQQPGSKKPSSEKPKGITIQMNRKDDKPIINPGMIMKKPSDNNSSSISITTSTMPTTKPDNKNQNNSASSKPPQQKQGLKIKLDPSLIKVRSKSSDNGINPQSVVANQLKSDNKSANQAPQESALPPGFENTKKEPQETKLPPGFENIHKEPKEIARPPGFENSQIKLPETDLKMPPGFSFSKNEDKVIPTGKEKKNTTSSSEPILKKKTTLLITNEKKGDAQKKLQISYKEDHSSENKIDHQIKNESDDSSSHFQIKSDKFASIFSKNKIVMNDKIIINDIKDAEQPKELQNPPGFTSEPATKPKFTINPAQIATRSTKQIIENKDREEPQKHENESQKQEQKATQKIHIEAKENTEQEAIKLIPDQKEDKEQKEKEAELQKEQQETPDQKEEDKGKEIPQIPVQKEHPEISDQIETEKTKEVPQISDKTEKENENEIPQIQGQKLEEEEKEKVIPQISIESEPKKEVPQNQEEEEKVKVIPQISIESEPKKEVPQNQEEEKEKIIPQISDQKKEVTLPSIISEPKELTDSKESQENTSIASILDSTTTTTTDDDIQKSTDQITIAATASTSSIQSDVVATTHNHFPFDDDDFDEDFDELQFMADLRSEYDEEEEEEEEEEHERIVILPSQLVAQPLEIEKRTPISANMTVEKIETQNPFASFEEIESIFGQTANLTSSSSNNEASQYVHFDSSQFPTSYGINDKIAYAFKQKGCRINVFDLNYGKLTSFQDNNLTSITAKGNVIVGSGNKELSFFKISKEALCSHNKIDLPNATSLVADPLDHTRFFFFTENDHSLYIVRYNEVKTKKDLVSNDVLSFDLCSKYLVVVSSSNGGIIRCKPRKEGSMFSLWERQIPTIENKNSSSINTGFDCFITDDYYIEKVGQKVTIFEAETLKMIQNLSHVVHVFKGGGNPLFLLTNGIIVHFKNAYRFPRPVICAVANKDNVVAWYSLDFAPYANKTVNETEKHSTFDKRKLKDMHSLIVTKTTNFIKDFSLKVNQKEKLFNVIDSAINNSEKAIAKFNDSFNELNSMVLNMTPKTSEIDLCFDLIQKGLFENGFENSLKLEKNDFVHFLNDKRVQFVLQSIKSINEVGNENDNDNLSNKKVPLSDVLLLKLADKIAAVIDVDCVNLVEWLNVVLLALDVEKRKVVVQSIADKIQMIMSKFSENVKEENTLSNLAMLNHIFSSSASPPSTV